jgi:hypothetical protein
MKIKLLKITPESLIQLMQGKPSQFASNLPDDAELIDLKLDLINDQVFIIIQSNSFEGVETNPTPEITQKTAEPKVAPKSTTQKKI